MLKWKLFAVLTPVIVFAAANANITWHALSWSD